MSSPRPAVASTRHILMLAALASMGQFANNIYLPSLPSIGLGLGAAPSLVQLTMTSFLVALAVMQLVYGPLSDRYGRRPLVIIGCLVYLVGCAVCALAPDILTLIIGRALQAAGASAGVVISRAIARDRYEGAELARAIGLVTMCFGLTPAVAPLLGGLLQTTFDWHANFVAAGVGGFLVLLVFQQSQPESLKQPLDRLNVAELVGAYREVLRSRLFVGYAIAGTGTLSGMFAFFTGSPFMMIQVLGVSPVTYGFYPPIGVVGFLVGSLLSRRFAHNARPETLARIGLAIQWVGASAMLGLPMLGLLHPLQIAGSIAIYTSGLGMLMPAVTTLAITPFARVAGTASATFGFMQMGGAAIATVIVSALALFVGPMAFAWVMLAATVMTTYGLWRAKQPIE